MAGYRVTDIETVVDERYWERPRPRMVPMLSGVDVDPGFWAGPVGSFPEKVARAGAFAVAWEKDEPFPPPQAHRVVAIASIELSGDDGRWYAFERMSVNYGWEYDAAAADEVEKSMLQEFGREQEADDATIVTWNGRTFDLPVINMRSFLHRVPCAWYYKEKDTRYRYTEAGHCDLMDVFSDHGAARSMKLGDVARLAGLPGKIGEVKGSSVGELYSAYKEGRPNRPFMKVEEAKRAVGDYCLLDALQTAILFALSRMHKGMIDVDYYMSVVKPSFDEPLAAAVRAVRGAA